MNTNELKKFAQSARRQLIEQTGARLKLVLQMDTTELREKEKAVKDLQAQIAKTSKNAVIDRVAYIWFNRFCALRFMDVNRYTKIGVVSPSEGFSQPEILQEAKQGHIDEELQVNKQKVFDLLSGKAVSSDPQQEAYRLLLVAVCNSYHSLMPFMFERIADYTELLMPDDLLSEKSILHAVRKALNEENCQDVEVIGWLYQFYISEKKDQVFEGLKKNKKITPENIPAATQLFTPHWIVKYLVENSLGRLWMQNRPNSRLVDRMEYYIRPDTSVGSEKWEVESKENQDGSAKLPGTNRLAEGDGYGGVGVSGNQGISQGGALRSDQPGSQSGSVDSVEHSGGASTSIDSGVQKLSIHSARIESRSGNANHDSSAAGVSSSTASRSDSQSIRRNQADDLFINREAEITSHSPLPTSHLRISSPEEIRICDPACGSGHMLTYAFDLLYSIYEEEGYDQKEIPNLILTKNLYGIEIDERAGALAAFALTMKARGKSRRFFRKPIQPNICVLQNVEFNEGEVKRYMDEAGRDLFTMNLQNTLHQFNEADNFGSLIRPAETDVEGIYKRLDATGIGSNLFFVATHRKVLQVLKQADYLSPKYHVVIANPPYMGGKGMNERLGAWAKENYPNSKSDLFAMFIEGNLDLAQKHGAVAMITMQSWMFLSSFEKLRVSLLGQNTLLSMAHLGARAFDSIGGEVVSTTAFVLEKANRLDYKGGYLRLVDGNSEAEKQEAIREAIKNPDCGWFYSASAVDFRKISGSPIAYWVSDRLRTIFESSASLSSVVEVKQGLATADNNRFLRLWPEVAQCRIGFDCHSRDAAAKSGNKWFPHSKGGAFRKWSGNREWLVNWENDGQELFEFRPRSVIRSPALYFKESLSWSLISSARAAFRFEPQGNIIGHKGPGIFGNHDIILQLAALLNSQIAEQLLQILAPTIGFEVGQVSQVPLVNVPVISAELIRIAEDDWNSYETSWDFTSLPLLLSEYHQPTLKATCQKLRTHWREMTLEMQRLEEENNRIFIEAYALQDELTPDVPLNEITLTCNPHYRYQLSGQWSVASEQEKEKELEKRLLEDTMKELVSYAVGCIFGRYALDKPGLILANRGETIEDYYRKVREPQMDTDGHGFQNKEKNICVNPCESVVQTSFPADDDNVIPILDGEWFIDDIAGRFRKFLKITFGEEHYEENIKFLEKAIGKDIRKYFLKDFYNDHVKMYKKRPIYWLFSSPNGSFNALIYMHRYRPDTVSIVLNDYLREFRTKLISRRQHLEAISISASASQIEKTKALKEIEKLKKTITELDDYERNILYPLATQKIEIDLDDGVKVNYPKFGAALKKIPGLS